MFKTHNNVFLFKRQPISELLRLLAKRGSHEILWQMTLVNLRFVDNQNYIQITSVLVFTAKARVFRRKKKVKIITIKG